MVKAYIEMYGERLPDGTRRPKGDPDISILKEPGNCQAICHDYSEGRVVSTIFKVDIPSPEIDRIVNAHPDHQRFDSDAEVQWRGLQIRPGTPTSAEVDDLRTQLQDELEVDISRSDPPREPPTGVPPTWVEYLKDHTKDIGVGYWLCEHPDHSSPERVPTGEGCSSEHDEANRYAQPNIPTFNVLRWK